MTRIQQVFASNLRKYRKAAHVSQNTLAERSGLNRTYIGGVEQQRVNLSLKNIGRIAEALDIDPVVLLLDEGETDGSSSSETAFLVTCVGGKATVQPIESGRTDLTVQVLTTLIDRGYEGAELREKYEHTVSEIMDFLNES